MLFFLNTTPRRRNGFRKFSENLNQSNLATSMTTRRTRLNNLVPKNPFAFPAANRGNPQIPHPARHNHPVSSANYSLYEIETITNTVNSRSCAPRNESLRMTLRRSGTSAESTKTRLNRLRRREILRARWRSTPWIRLNGRWCSGGLQSRTYSSYFESSNPHVLSPIQ